MEQLEVEHQLSVNPDEGIGHKGILYVPDPLLGHDEIEWKEGDQKSLDKAKKLFEDKLKQGWQAFKEVIKSGKGEWEKIDAFDADAGRLLLLPLSKKLAGGG